MGNEIKGIDTAAIATAIQTLGHAKALLSSAQAQYGNGEPCPMRIDVGNSYVDGLCDKSTIETIRQIVLAQGRAKVAAAEKHLRDVMQAQLNGQAQAQGQ